MNINQNWNRYLDNVTEKDYFQAIMEKVNEAYDTATVYPPKKDVFSFFDYVAPEDVKVIVLGQDPYHNEGEAHGLAFSVPEGFKLPPSLRNIYKELYHDLGIDNGKNGNLTKWAKQGILLLNTCLTVEKNQPNSHRHFGWDEFTDQVIRTLGHDKTPRIFLLWGSHAQKKSKLINQDIHYILTAPHPSPLSAYRGFWDSKPFSQINEILKKEGKKEIDWQI